MAIRNIVKFGDEVLNKKCRPVERFDEKLWLLLDDMKETLEDAQGAGLAAPQVGMLRQVCVVDVGEGPIELVNPEIIATEGEQTGLEGCLSDPGEWGVVTRPRRSPSGPRTETAPGSRRQGRTCAPGPSATRSTT